MGKGKDKTDKEVIAHLNRRIALLEIVQKSFEEDLMTQALNDNRRTRDLQSLVKATRAQGMNTMFITVDTLEFLLEGR